MTPPKKPTTRAKRPSRQWPASPAKVADPTWIPIQFDPREQRMSGVAVHGRTPFDVPYVSHIEGKLWVGGCEKGLMLPGSFQHVVSLYPWERYTISHKVGSETYAYWYDDGLPDLNELEALATWVLHCLEGNGDTLVHCQAGLNRSNLLAAYVLMKQGKTAKAAIALLRKQRSSAVLCNRNFARWLEGYAKP